MTTAPNNILVIQMAKLGDMVCTTPVFRAIKKRYPGSTLIVAGDSVNNEVLRGNPNVDQYVIAKELTSAKIKEMKIGIAVLLNPNPALLFRLLSSRVPTVIVPKVTGGYSPYVTKSYRLLSLFATKVEHRMGHYAPQEYLNMLKPLGIVTDDTKKDVYIDALAEKRGDGVLSPAQGKLKVGIAPGAGNTIKEWPPAKFAQVAQHFAQDGRACVVLIGGPKDAPLSQIVKSGLADGSVIDTVGKLTIEELKAVVKRLDIFISADTGPIYIAEALSIPTIDIIGPVDEREQPPQGPKHSIVVPPGRVRPELFVMNARHYNHTEAARLAASTEVREVIEAAERLLTPR